MNQIKWIIPFITFIMLSGCQSYKASVYKYPEPVDTNNKAIDMQEKKQYAVDGLLVDNLFDGARLNHFEQVDENTFRAVILPENYPINKSPWFSFRISSDKSRVIELFMDYTHSAHRYIPKISFDRKNWTAIDTNLIVRIDSQDIRFPLMVDNVPVYVSAQELITSKDNAIWTDSIARHDDVRKGVYAKSVGGKDLEYLDIYRGEKENKAAVVVLSRQHPPEISGYLAMQHFMESILDSNVISEKFRERFRVLVFPMLNPDGVDQGHWRHNLHGIDLNRDWGVYIQAEIRQTVDFIVKEVKQNKNEVLLGLDFHSTQEDIFYTYADSLVSVIPNFTDFWLYGIDKALPDYELDEEASGITKPYSKVWFYTQFGAESITYEVGDETDREFIKDKAQVAAMEMMKLLMFYDGK